MVAALATLAIACKVQDLDLEGKTCPCPAPLRCDQATDRCVRDGTASGGGQGGRGGGCNLPGAGLPLIFHENDYGELWIEQSTNCVGITAQLTGAPNPTLNSGVVCMSGTVTTLDTLGVQAVLTMSPGEEPYDPAAHGVTGFEFELTGRSIPKTLRFGYNDPASGFHCVDLSGPDNHHSALLRDMRYECHTNAEIGAAEGPRLQLVVFTVLPTETETPFDYCVASFKAMPAPP